MAYTGVILKQSDPTTWDTPPEGKTYLGVNDTGSLVIKQSDGTLAVISPGTASLTKVANSDGAPITVTPLTIAHKQVITLTGAARTQVINIAETSLSDGASCALLFNLPATAGIVIEVYSDSSLIWSYVNQTGAAQKARFQLYKDGAVWAPEAETIPSYTPAS